jgi:co-chaperonin GroES (HSP10)
MEMLNRVEFDYGSLEEAFPEIDPLVTPCGDNVLVQMRSPKQKTKGGIHLITDVQDTEFWANQVAKVLALGPVAYKHHQDLTDWPEGPWCKVGDFVRVPKHGGDRWTVKVPGGEHESLIVMFKAREVIGVITGNPFDMKSYI